MNVIAETIQAWWGRERLRKRVANLEEALRIARLMFKSLRETNQFITDANRQQGETVARLEQENVDLRETVKQWAESARKIDPNAKCPGCGATKGFLTHVVGPGERPEIRVVNNCKECGLPFISGEPIAGDERIRDLYQPGQASITPRTLGEASS